MNDHAKSDTTPEKESQQPEKATADNFVVKLVQNLLELNLHTYKKEKVSRLGLKLYSD